MWFRTVLSLTAVTLVLCGDFDEPNTWHNRTVLVHLFEWKWSDIANECEQFLSKYNYGAVQISPPQEHITFIDNDDIPWYVRYQPVSYKLESRSGNEEQLRDMITRCNKVGVRVIADVVLNHMTGIGQKYGENGRKSSGGSTFDANHGVEQFPGVPYGPGDFNDPRCDHDIEGSDYQNNAWDVKTCRLSGLLDLDQGKDYVQGKIREYLNKLIDLGVAGFRFDASKHMWPDNLKQILFGGVNNLRSDIFGNNVRPFVVHEVIDRGGEAVKVSNYIAAGRYTKDLANLKEGYHYGNGASNDVLNFIDNHDNQRDEPPYVVTYKDGIKYKMSISFLLAWDYGLPRVMSSYYFTDRNRGPPNYGSGKNYETKSPTFNNNDETCNSDSGWVCEHRWPEIRRMVHFRSLTTDSPVVQIQQGHQMLAFARQNRGYIALSNNDQDYVLNDVNTTLPPGQYCDIASGEIKDGRCTSQRIITVDNNGKLLYFAGIFLTMKITMHSMAAGLWYIDQSLIYNSSIYHLACETTLDCPLELSCFFASAETHGCCLPILRPNETNCIINEQCSRACKTSYCNQKKKRCLCQPGYHFLFGKCWSQCPSFAIKEAQLFEDDPATQCLLNRDELTAELKGGNRQLKRKRRELQRNNYC
ncbi:Glycosyl hydrolase and Alpha-amylase domain containing protein [Aphelenchoides besseyi]|nr:Glycosyl hydrolase and Alpha-amylase domain containing protein [Aphelenchoides besseyi]KAI6201191.1 Glycosyl hydrolase and Alpha-amylase domain containing protein [Aphelenchoides besseyi]